MKWKVIHASVRGSAHQRTGAPNQDAVDYGVAAKSEPPATVLAVSDGHGGARHFRSQVGSMLAVRVAVEAVRAHLAGALVHAQGHAPTGELSNLGRSIVEAWLSAVGSDLANNPLTDAELTALAAADGPTSRESVVEHPELAYGATLLVAAATGDRMIYMQLGDGDILTVAADGATMRPISADDRLVGNQTTSLCQPQAWLEFRTAETAHADGLPVLVLLSTDGYVNSFRSQEDFLQIGADYLQILRDQGSDSLAEELPRILSDATRQGSGDDITLGLLHVEVLPAAGTAKAAATAAPGLTKSAMIRELTEERSTQQKKLAELESHFAGVRKHVLQLRLLVAAVVLIAIGALGYSYWRPLMKAKAPAADREPIPDKRPGRGGKDPAGKSPDQGRGHPVDGPVDDPLSSPVPADPPVAATPAAGDHWFLVVDGGKEVALTSGATLSSDQLVPDEATHAYARVKKQDNILVLTNMSSDAWTVTSPNTGRKSIYKQNDFVTLHPDMKISFHKGATATIAVRSH